MTQHHADDARPWILMGASHGWHTHFFWSADGEHLPQRVSVVAMDDDVGFRTWAM